MSLKEIGPFVHAKGPIFKDFYGVGEVRFLGA